jgi:2-dehydro-3-deoxy-D-arabinonate dehydratase
VAVGVFRVQLGDGSYRLARGDPGDGPQELLPADVTLDMLLSEEVPALAEARALPSAGDVPADARIRAPVESQEVWAAGVTYLRSREARAEESADATPYDLVYTAERPELFFKSAGWRVRGPGEDVAVRTDSEWNTPEPELALVLGANMRIAGYTIGDDVSSRTIEGENPLYLPQAKVYDGACALGPCIVPAGDVDPPFAISLEVLRGDAVEYRGATSTEHMKRSFDELASYLGRALAFPTGAVLLTGTGLVPDPPFSLMKDDVVRISIEGLGLLENPVTTVGALDPAPAPQGTGA